MEDRILIFGRSIDKGSDEVYDYMCTPCNKRKLDKEAILYCPNCACLYCDKCLASEHSGYTLHRVVKVKDWGQTEIEVCPICEGSGSKAKRFCRQHDIVCCYICEQAHHSKCVDVSDIAEISKGVDFDCMKNELMSRQKDAEKQLTKYKKAAECICEERKKSINNLDSFKTDIEEIFERLDEEARADIEETYYKINEENEFDVEASEEFLADLRLQMMMIESKNLTESHIFLHKRIIRKMTNKRDDWLRGRQSDNRCNLENLMFDGDQQLLLYLENINSLREQQEENLYTESDSVAIGKQGQIDDSIDVLVNDTAAKLMQEIKQKKDNEPQAHLDYIMNRIKDTVMSELNDKNTTVEHEPQNSAQSLAHSAQFLDDDRPRLISQRTQDMTQTQQTGNHCKTPRRSMSEPFQTTKATGSTLLPLTSHLQANEAGKSHADCFDIKLEVDEYQCNIQGISGLPDETILLSDTKNKKIKQINQEYKIIDYCALPAGPRGVCGIQDNEAAAALNNKTIQFLALRPKMKLTYSLELSHACYGLSHYDGNLYVTALNGKEVFVYNTSGSQLRIISGKHLSGSSLLNSTQHVYITRDGTRVYVADKNKGLVILSSSGKLLSNRSQPELKHACGVCTDHNGNVYVSGWQSHNVVKYRNRGMRALETVVPIGSGARYPTAIWWNKYRRHMIVSSNPEPFGSDTLRFYEIDCSP